MFFTPWNRIKMRSRFLYLMSPLIFHYIQLVQYLVSPLIHRLKHHVVADGLIQRMIELASVCFREIDPRVTVLLTSTHY